MLNTAMRNIGDTLRVVRPGVITLASSRWTGFLGLGLRVTSPAFAEGQPIPVRYTADGEGACPPLRWERLPPQTRSVALLVEDADAPWVRPLVHLIVHSVSPELTEFADGEIPRRQVGFSPRGFGCGRNSLGRPGWMAPRPPPGHGKHQYAFQVFALDATPEFPYPPGRAMLLRMIRPHLLAQGRLIGTYERP